MPLVSGSSKEAFKQNVSTLMGEIGKSPHVQSRSQALAIAFSKQRRGKQEGGLVGDEVRSWVQWPREDEETEEQAHSLAHARRMIGSHNFRTDPGARRFAIPEEDFPTPVLRPHYWEEGESRMQGGGLVQPTPQPETDASAPHPDDDHVLIDVAPLIERPAYVDTLERLHDTRMQAQGIHRQTGGPAPLLAGARGALPMPAPSMPQPQGTAPIVGSPPTPGGGMLGPAPAMPPLASPWATSNPMRNQGNQWPTTGLYSSGGGIVGEPGHYYQHGGLTGPGMSSLGRQAHYSGMNARSELRSLKSAPVKGIKLVQSTTPGRTDRIPMTARAGSFVLPADVVSGLGQGNTLAGAKMWGQAISHSAGPYGQSAAAIPHARMPSLPRPAMPRSPRGTKAFQEGGDVNDDGHTTILVAGGEVIVDPDYVTGVGGGDLDKGSKLLHESVLSVRKQVGDNTKLPEPVK